ncbi:MAG: type II toxin-antitoxin system HigB family toxin [Bacteroidetes bacterium]|nr:type II toxin-antitoxin system HigB family toxin [Bacteroidota bacterium]
MKIKEANWANPNDMKNTFRSIDLLGNSNEM